MLIRFFIAGFTVLLLPMFVIACSDDDNDSSSSSGAASGEAAQVEQTINAVVASYNSKDLTTFLGYWTDDGLMTEFGVTREEVMLAGVSFFEGPPLVLNGISNTKVKGSEANSDVEFVFGIALDKTRYALVKQDIWKINGGETLKSDVPSGVAAVPVKMDEFSFDFDLTKAATGNVAFDLDNVGKQPHEFVMIKTPEGFGIQQLLSLGPTAELPPGTEFVGAAGPIPSGEDGRMVLSQRLQAGKYLVVCFLPDANNPQTPHAAEGMAVEFNVTPQQGGN